MTSGPSTQPRFNHLGVFLILLLLLGFFGLLLAAWKLVELSNFDARMQIMLSVVKASAFLGLLGLVFFAASILRAALRGRLGMVWMIAVTGLVVAFAMCVVTCRQYAVYQSAMRTDQSIKNLRVLALAFVAFGRERGVPPAHTRDSDYQPLLSWRVHLLEYFDPDLYKRFRLDEPWDSPHNRQLVDEMPAVYRSPLAPSVADGKTCYVMAVGDGAFYPYPASYLPRTSEQIVSWNQRDGQFGTRRAIRRYSAGTLMILETLPDKAVIWTKPDDLRFDPRDPKAELIDDQRDFFLAITADLTPRMFSSQLSDATVRNLFLNDRAKDVDVTGIADGGVRSYEAWTIYVGASPPP